MKTKKIALVVAVVSLLFFSGSVLAKNDKDKKSPEAREIKVHKKEPISDAERKAMDEASKGKPASKSAKDKVSVWAGGVIGEPLPEGGERYAVVAGLANYDGTAYDLCVPEAKTTAPDADVFPEYDIRHYCQDEDALNMKEVLIKFGYDEENIVHLRDGQATRQGIWDELDALAGKAGENDEVVFFFSGHGTSGRLVDLVDKEPIDEAIFTYDWDYIWDDELKAWADGLNVNRAVFAFDSCLSGGMNDLSGTGRVIAMSSGEKQSSYTYYLGGTQTEFDDTPVYQESEGLFSHYFVKRGMRDELADGSNLLSKEDGKIAVEESFTYTYPIVKYRQTPVLSDKFSDDLILGIQI